MDIEQNISCVPNNAGLLVAQYKTRKPS